MNGGAKHPGAAYLILMLTTKCNLSCSYCYLGSHINNQASAVSAKTDMTRDTIDNALKLANNDKNSLHVQLTGGEPFLVPELVQYAAEKIREKFAGATIGIQTNATLLDNQAINIIKKSGLEPGISLDGEPLLQDSQRGMAHLTFKGIHLLEQNKIPFNITSVVTKANMDSLLRLVLMLGNFSMARGIGLDFLVLRGSAEKNGISMADARQAEQGIKDMLKALNMVNAARKTPLIIREFEKIKRIKKEKKTNSFCHGATGKSLAVTPEGELFPCSQTAFDDKFHIGSLKDLKEGSFLCTTLSEMRLDRYQKKQCIGCDLGLFCPGDCPSRLYYNKGYSAGLICKVHETFYKALKDKEEMDNDLIPEDKKIYGIV